MVPRDLSADVLAVFHQLRANHIADCQRAITVTLGQRHRVQLARQGRRERNAETHRALGFLVVVFVIVTHPHQYKPCQPRFIRGQADCARYSLCAGCPCAECPCARLKILLK